MEARLIRTRSLWLIFSSPPQSAMWAATKIAEAAHPRGTPVSIGDWCLPVGESRTNLPQIQVGFGTALHLNLALSLGPSKPFKISYLEGANII